MQIVMNDNLKEALKMTCKYANEYKVDIDVHFDADGEVSVSVTPTYRDRAEQTEPNCSEKPNNLTISKMEQVEQTEPTTEDCSMVEIV